MVAQENPLAGLNAVLLLHGYRTGSNHVSSVLEHNGLGRAAERFNLKWQQSVKALDPEAIRQNATEVILQNAPHGLFACKLPLQDFLWLTKSIGDFSNPIGSITRQFGRCAVVVINRQDIFLQAVSLWRARATGEWFRRHDSKASPPAPAFDRDGINKAYIYLCREEYLWQELIARSPVAPIRITYEAFEAEPDRLLDLANQIADQIDPDRALVARDLKLKSVRIVQRDELSWEYRNKFIDGLMQSYTAT
jgi:LPS sulfotransferase NodH